MGLDDIFVLFQSRIKIRVDNPLLYQFVLDAVIDDFRVVLGADAGQRRLFRFGDPQAVKRILDVIGNVVPVGFHLGVRADISDDIVHIEFTDIRAPVGIFHMIKDIEGFEAEIEHPLRFVFLFRNFADNVFREPCFRLVGIVKILFKIIHIAEIGEGIDFLTFCVQFFFPFFDQLFFFISHSPASYSACPLKASYPLASMVWMSDASPLLTMRPLMRT